MKTKIYPLFGNVQAERLDPNAKPRYLVIDENLRVENTLWVHTAGSPVIWERPVLELVRNDRFIRGLDPVEAMRLGWSACDEHYANKKQGLWEFLAKEQRS